MKNFLLGASPKSSLVGLLILVITALLAMNRIDIEGWCMAMGLLLATLGRVAQDGRKPGP